MDNTLASFMVALGFDVNQGSLNTAKKSVADYEKAVRDAEKRIEDARWEGAKTVDEIAKLTREANLKEARAALATAQEREKAEKETAQKRQERNKEFMAGMSRLALAATAAATAISYAVNRVTQAFDNLGFVSARTGASVQSLNSLGYAFKQVGGSSQQAVSAVEKFAQALRTNDGLKSYVKGLGVDTTKDMADQLLDTVEALSKHEYQVGSREAGMLGISEEDYKLLTQYAAKVKEYRAEYDATTKSLGVNSKEAADASMAFQRTLTRLQATVSALGDKLMVSLAPALEAIVKRFQDWISANPEKVEKIMRGISDAVVWLAEKLGAMVTWFAGNEGDAFMKRWDAFADRVKAIASAFETIFGVLKKIAGVTHLSTILGAYDKTIGGILAGPAAFEKAHAGEGAGNSFDAQREHASGDRPGLFRRAARAVRRALGGGSVEAAETGEYTGNDGRRSRGATSAEGRENVASWLAFLQKPVADGGLGMPLGKAQATVAMMQGESGGNLDPRIIGDSGHAHGTAQWSDQNGNPRFPLLKKFAASQGKDWRDRGIQQQYLRMEMLGMPGAVSHNHAYRAMMAAENDAKTLMEGIAKFENPQKHALAFAIRHPFLRRLQAGGAGRDASAPAVAAPTGAAPAAATRGMPSNMTPGGFDVNAIMQPAPNPNVVNNSTSSSRAVNQTFNQNTTIHGAENPRQAARIMESAFGNMHTLALQNAQSATV